MTEIEQNRNKRALPSPGRLGLIHVNVLWVSVSPLEAIFMQVEDRKPTNLKYMSRMIVPEAIVYDGLHLASNYDYHFKKCFADSKIVCVYNLYIYIICIYTYFYTHNLRLYIFLHTHSFCLTVTL